MDFSLNLIYDFSFKKHLHDLRFLYKHGRLGSLDIRRFNSRLLSIAETKLAEFLTKATGTAVDWVQMPGMKPGPDLVGIFAISQSCSGVAARACGLIEEILKDRPSWFRECRSLEVFTMFPAGNSGTIELIYTQVYAPTTLAPARDFWTLRYTITLENGSFVICERSLSGSGAGPSAASASQFVRAEMLPSGYLIRPCDGGGSIHIVDHLNLEAWSVPEVLRPEQLQQLVFARFGFRVPSTKAINIIGKQG